MVNTAISDIASMIEQNPAKCKIITGELTADTYPGQIVVLVSGKWVKADADTAAHNLRKIGVVGYVKRRVPTAKTEPTIDEAWDITYETQVPIIISGICAAFIDDQVATVYPQLSLIISGTAGQLTTQALAATGATSGTAYRATEVATLASGIVSGDTKAFIALGDCLGEIM
jgi:hypothetical protein